MKVVIFNRLNDSTFDNLTLEEKIEQLRKAILDLVHVVENPE